MFNKLTPMPITNKNHRLLLVVAMIWFFVGAWIDSSAHTYLIEDIETFFTPWHAVLYSGYAFSVFVAMYVKNTMKDYKFDVGVLGAASFAPDDYDGDGKLNATEAYEVLGKVHFDELNSRITTAAAGGIHTIVGTAPIGASTNAEGTTATLTILDATIGQKGAVQLIETLNEADNTMACTGKAVASYAVPMDLSQLPNLEDA